MVGLSGAHSIDGLIIDGSPGGAIMFGSNMHSALPGHRGVEGHALNDSKSDIPHQTLVHSLLPVQGDHSRAVDSNWFGSGVCVELQWGAVL